MAVLHSLSLKVGSSFPARLQIGQVGGVIDYFFHRFARPLQFEELGVEA
jgi:hypothetical protein